MVGESEAGESSPVDIKVLRAFLPQNCSAQRRTRETEP